MTLKPNTRDLKIMEEEIDHMGSKKDITTQNYEQYVEVIVNGSEVTWIPKICSTCGKPPYLHDREDQDCQATVKLLKGWQTDYKVLMKNSKTVKTEVEEVITRLHLSNPQNKSNKEEGKFPIWDQSWSWEEYKANIVIFNKGSTKKPIMKFQDMIAALQESKKPAIAQRLTDTFKTRCEETNIMTEILAWMSSNYGKNTSELIGDVVQELKSFKRERNEGMMDYIARFDNLCMKCSDMRVGLSDRFKASLMKESAEVTEVQKDNINTLCDLGSDDPNLTEKMRQALRRINIKVKEEVLLAEPEYYEEYTWDPEQQEEVLFGEPRGQWYTGQRGGQNNYGQQHQQQGHFQQRPRSRGRPYNYNNNNRGPYQGQGQPCSITQQAYNTINQMTPAQQQEFIAGLSKAYGGKQTQGVSGFNHAQQIPKLVYQVDNKEV